MQYYSSSSISQEQGQQCWGEFLGWICVSLLFVQCRPVNRFMQSRVEAPLLYHVDAKNRDGQAAFLASQ